MAIEAGVIGGTDPGNAGNRQLYVAFLSPSRGRRRPHGERDGICGMIVVMAPPLVDPPAPAI